jgi:hypothetical protein
LLQQRHVKSIDGFYRSYVLLPAEADATRAVVFVHGFAGSPTGTWCDFHGLSREYSDEYPWWKDAALFFYSYESTQRPIIYNSVRFRSFLNSILGRSHVDKLIAVDDPTKECARAPLLVAKYEGVL